MQEFDRWTLNTIRYDDALMSWLEERRYDWMPLAVSALEKLLSGQSVIIVTDEEREWFGDYILSSINRPHKNRPLLPFYRLKDLYPYIDRIKKAEDVDILYDMLSLSFKDDYFFWYIGKSESPRCQIAKRKDDSFLWIMDEEMQNSFYLKSFDDLLDLKLFQLFRLFDKSIDAAMFGEVEIKL
ncbi:HobA family DNA replication regulator [Nitrosophilus alvini]|uniref:HobA family DNA replication regulator n=1 Tax=Nitrosophilus alvini TaxID=2714855 RepID=UPI0019091729|nr:HobA family DNA replication regulator [Nitrosophilus alvini]